MNLAIREGEKGLGNVQPNPPVGCVILDVEGQVVARGAHLEFGGPHAEINALNNIEDRMQLEDATFVVTLEPCAFEGKTPSCAKTLASLPIKRVVYGCVDPNPRVAGQGHKILSDAGVAVELVSDTDLQAKCSRLAEVFMINMLEKRPFVGLKAATTSNGSLKPEEGQWVSSRESREHVQLIRNQYEAILIGVDTFLEDNPKLNIRIDGVEKENIVVVLDPSGRGLDSLPNSNLLKCREPQKIIWVTKDPIATEFEIENLVMESSAFEPKRLVEALWDRQIHSLLIEGGAKTYSHFIKAKCVDRIHHYESKVKVDEAKILHWLGGDSEPKADGPIEEVAIGPDIYRSYRLPAFR